MFKWILGRQQTNYYKLPIFILSFCDCYLLKYIEQSFIPDHTDPVDSYKHYRLNIEIIKPKEGGEFICDNVIFKFWRLVLFRPDLNNHSVSIIKKGNRYVLSFGLALK